MKQVIFLLAIIAASFTVKAQQAHPQQINGITINPVIVTTETGRDTVNVITASIGSIVNVTDSFIVNVNYFFAQGNKGVPVKQTQYPAKETFALADFTGITAGTARYNAIITALLHKLSLVKRS